MREPPWDIRADLQWGTIPAMLRAVAARSPQQPCIVDGPTRLTYAQLSASADDVARAFLACGAKRGDRIAVWLPNTWEWVAAAVGAQRAGGVLVPVNTRFKGAEAADVLRRSQAVGLVTSTCFLGTDYTAMLRDALAQTALPALRTIVGVGGPPALGGAMTWQDFLNLGPSVSIDRVHRREEELSGTDLSDILFTSGTTGYPKGVMCTHAQTLRAYRDWSEIVGIRAGDQYLIVSPFFHAFGYKAGWLASLMMGATIHPMAALDVNLLLDMVARHRVTVLPGSPTLFQSLLANPRFRDYDLSSLRLAVTGAAVVPFELIRRMREQLTFRTIITGYGLSEACGIATMSRQEDSPETIAATSGRPIPDTAVIVVDARGEPVIDEPGDVLVRGYHVMSGYYDEPDATRAVIDDEGWLHTGDIGVIDARGYLRITDRKKDMFIVGGFNAYPAEIENIILHHQAVSQVAVIGVPDPRQGEVGMAFIVPLPGQTVSERELIEWCRQRMANFKVPRYVEITERLPLNPSGKVLKTILRQDAAQRLGGTAQAPASHS